MMRILVITPYPPDHPSRDGMTLIIYHLLRNLGTKHHLTVWASSNFAQPATLWKHYLKLDHTPWYGQQHFAPQLAEQLRKLTTREYDLIYLHSPFSLGYASYLPTIPTVVGLIDTMSDWFGQAARYTSTFKKIHFHREQSLSYQLEHQLLTRPPIKKIIVASPGDKVKLNQHDKVVVIPNGVDTEQFVPQPNKPQSNTIIFTGVMNYPPNVDAVRCFYRTVWPQCRQLDLRWLIVGKEPTKAIQTLGKQDSQITVTGNVPSIVPYLQSATIYISPVRYGTGIKNKLLEAMACGLPIITLPTSVGGLEAAPLKVVTLDQFANTIKQLVEEPSAAQLLGQQARSYVEAHHTWSTVSAQYEQVFKDCL